MESRIQNTWNQGYRIHGIKDTEIIESRINNTWIQGYRIHEIKNTEYRISGIQDK